MEFYNYDKICSYNAIWNFVLTNRGYGKSYGLKKRCIRNFLKKGEQFIYLRRWKTELKDNDKWFDDIRKEFPNNELEFKFGKFYVDGNIAGFPVALSVSQRYKSVAYPNVTTIMFDEFLVDRSAGMRYITNEVDVALDFYETVARTRNNVRMFFLGNNISRVNPYFTYFNVKVNDGERFTLARDGEMVIEYSTNDAFIEMKKETKFGKLIRNTKYSDYAIDNKSLRDSNTFVEQMSLKHCDEYFAIEYKSKKYMVWGNIVKDILYITDKPTKTVRCYSVLASDHNDNTFLNNKYIGNSCFNNLIRYFQFGKVRFKTIEIKITMYDLLKDLGVK